MPKLTRETQDSAELHKSVDEKKRVARRQLNLTKPQTAGWGRLRRLSTKAGNEHQGPQRDWVPAPDWNPC